MREWVKPFLLMLMAVVLSPAQGKDSPYGLEDVHYRAVVREFSYSNDFLNMNGVPIPAGSTIEGWHFLDDAAIKITHRGNTEVFLITRRNLFLPRYAVPRKLSDATALGRDVLMGRGANNGLSFDFGISPVTSLWAMLDENKTAEGFVGVSRETGFFKAEVEWDAPNGHPLNESMEVRSESPLVVRYDAGLIAEGSTRPYTPTSTVFFEGECPDNRTGRPFPARATISAYPADLSTREIARIVVEYTSVEPAEGNAEEVFDRLSKDMVVLELMDAWDYAANKKVFVSRIPIPQLESSTKFTPQRVRMMLAVGGLALIALGILFRWRAASRR